MRPTLRQLQYLISVAETGRFRDAARQMNVSQPSLSTQIADMEAELGTILLERGRNGARLTPAGDEIVRRARLILRDVEDLKASAHRDPGELSGLIRLGVLPTIGPYLLPASVRKLHATFPRLRLFVSEQRTVDLGSNLEDGRFDTVISTPADHPSNPSQPLFDESFWVCAAQDDPIAQATGPVELGELTGRGLLTLGYGHKLNTIIHSLAEAAGAIVRADYEGTSLDAVRQMAETGAGIAVLPSLYAVSEARRDPELRLRRIAHPLARREIALVWRASSPLSDAMSDLGGHLERTAREILVDEAALERTSHGKA